MIEHECVLMAAARALALVASRSAARADAFVDEAKAVVAKATARADKWDGPTTRPEGGRQEDDRLCRGRHAQRRHPRRRRGRQGSRRGDRLDLSRDRRPGHGLRPGRGAQPGDRAEARRHHRRRLRRRRAEGGPRGRRPSRASRSSAGMPGRSPARWTARRSSPTSRPMPMEVAKVAAMKAIADSDGKAGVVIFADSAYAIAIAKGRAMEAVIKKCERLHGAGLRGYAARRHLEPHAAAHHLAAAAVRRQVDAIRSRSTTSTTTSWAPRWQSAGIEGDGDPQNISAGDGSESAYQRIRAKDYQAATVPEPLNMQGWQLVDELNRAFAKAALVGLRPGRPSRDAPTTSTSTAARRTCSTPTTATATLQEDLGREVAELGAEVVSAPAFSRSPGTGRARRKRREADADAAPPRPLKCGSLLLRSPKLVVGARMSRRRGPEAAEQLREVFSRHRGCARNPSMLFFGWTAEASTSDRCRGRPRHWRPAWAVKAR